MMCMEPISTMILARCYKASVNESETITEAKPFCWVRDGGETGRVRGLRCQVFEGVPPSNGAELGSVRKCRLALRAWPGDSARPQFPDPRPLLPVPYRALGRRQDLAAAAVVSVAAADPGPRQSVRPGRVAARQGSDRRPAQADRHR